MTMGTNIPGMYDYTVQKQRQKQPGSGPFMPGPTAPTPTIPQPPAPQGPQSPMGGYVNRQAQSTLNAKPPIPPVSPYRVTPAAPAAGTTPPAQPQVTVAPNPAPQVQATPPASPAPVTPAAPVMPAAAGPMPQAGQTGSTLQDPGQITDVGKQYAGQYGSGLKDVGQMTEAGKLYADRVTKNLQGNNPLVENAQATADTAAARRGYTARKYATEGLAQTHFAPGTAQYQRAMAEAQAGVDTANQQGQNEVNDFTRKTTADALNAANDLEVQQYNRSSAERTAAGNFEDQQYGRAIGERTNARTSAADLGNSITDPKAKYAFNAMVAAGVDPKVAYQQIVGSTGTINKDYRGQSPVETVRQDATDWIKNTTALQEGTPEFNAAVTQRMKDLDATKNAPVQEAKTTAEQKAIEEKIRSGTPLTEAEQAEAIAKGTIPEFTPSNLGGYKDQKVADLIGKPINIGGKVYTVVQGSRTRTGAGTFTNQERHTDWTEIKDQGGKSWYVYNGKLNEKPPKKVSNDISPFGF